MTGTTRNAQQSEAVSSFIGIFDSGVGGLSVWREIARQFPHEDTLYLADQAHVPYGLRRLTTVRELSESITRFLLSQGAKVIVVACNTASAAALHYLRHTFPQIPFVGMEPAVKPASERTRTGIIGVIATPATFQGELFASLVEQYAGDVRVLTQVCPGLVEAVESGALDTPETKALLRECLTPLIEGGADQLVLGCTHYPFLRTAIEQVVGVNMAVIDPAPAVARQTGRVLARLGLKTNPGRAGHHVFYTSGDLTAFTTVAEWLFPSYGNSAKVRAVRWREGRLETEE
ncbi:MAG: glutamate racemase [Chloroflexota bacterium]|nr:glutamate racemase [Chloroflexota bacterium]